MAERSDWSGELLDGDSPTEVTVRLDDGTRRRLKVGRAEQVALSERGVDVTGPLDRLAATVRKHSWKGLRWIVAGVLAALIGQYVAGYYADRQQALDLKSALITKLSTAAVRGYDLAFDVVNVGVERHQRGFAVIRARNRATAVWTSAEAEIDPLVWLHFDGSAADRHWGRYEEAVFDLLRLSYVDDATDRPRLAEVVHNYLEDYPPPRPIAPPYPTRDPWTILMCRSLRCSEAQDWRAQYRWLGLTLLRARGGLARDILDADAHNLG